MNSLDAATIDWNNTFKLKEQYKFLQQKSAIRCKHKIDMYTKKLKDDPSSSYYQFKLKSWKERCQHDSKTNPYIK